MTTNLWLSPHGIWYFRKVYLLPSGKRKEIRKSLRTRCKRTAQALVLNMLIPTNTIQHSHNKTASYEPVQESHLSNHKQTLTLKIFKDNLDKYLTFKARHCAEREQLSIKRFILRYTTFLTNHKNSNPISTVNAAAFIDSLQVSIPTKNKHASKIGGYLHWLNKRLDIEITNPFASLTERHQVSRQKQRQAYTVDQAAKLMKLADDFVEWKKWVVLLGRYTGMRCNEICQLHRDDVFEQQGIWCVSVNKNHDYKRLKTSASARLIPLPTNSNFNLSEFLIFVQGRNGRLFHEATIYKDNCAHYLGKWFNRWRLQHGLPEFHSLRHLVATELKDAGLPEQYAAALLGHSIRGITFGRYGKDVTLQTLNDSIKIVASKL